MDLSSTIKEIKNVFNDVDDLLEVDLFGNPLSALSQSSSSGGASSGVNDMSVGVGKDDGALHSDVRGLWLGNKEFDLAPFRVDMLGNAVMESLLITSAVIKAGKESLNDVARAGTYIDSDGIFIGNAGDTHSFKFDVNTGELVIKGANVDGALVTDFQEGSDLAFQAWQLTSTFSSSTYRKIAWTSGTLSFQDGQSFSITAGDTDNMSSSTPYYIYFNKATPTVLSVTTTASTALGPNKLLVAVAYANTDTSSGARLQAFGGTGGNILNADNIVTNAITAGAIKAGAVTANKLSIVAQKQNHNVAFTTTYPDYCAWGAGTIYFADGTTASVDAGNTGRLMAITSAFSSDADTLALWHFDEASGSTLDNAEGDASWDITCTGTTVITGKFSNGRDFNGSSDYAKINDYSELDQDIFSVEGWFKTDSTVGNTRQYLVSRSYTNASATERYFDVYLLNKRLYATIYPYSSSVYYPKTLVSNYDVDDSTWHHFRMTYNKTAGYFKLMIDGYLHGQLTDTQVTYGLRASAQPLYFAKSDLATPGYFDGKLDEFRYSSIVRNVTTPAERYIYYDSDQGATLQVTTDKSTITGDKKLLLCTMTPKDRGAGAALEVFMNNGTTIVGESIKTGIVTSADGRTYLDLNNNRLVINDGLYDRVILGRF